MRDQYFRETNNAEEEEKGRKDTTTDEKESATFAIVEEDKILINFIERCGKWTTLIYNELFSLLNKMPKGFGLPRT